jgi:protein kinase C substrate 80K-H
MRIFFQQYYDKILPHLTNDNKDGNNNNSNNSEKEKEKVEENSDNVDYDQDNGEVNNGDSAAHEQHDTTQHEEHKQPEVIEPQVNKQKYDEQTTVLLDEAQKARDEFENAKRELSNIENDITNAKKKLEYDVGVSEEFMSMIDECFEFEDREYTYKLCPYERTVQISKANSGETSIGNWVSWGEEGQDKYKTMKFANGQSCWNGPARSTVVKLSCGIENKITSVSEPNRCEYEMKFETPSLCDPTNTQSTNSHLNHDEF